MKGAIAIALFLAVSVPSCNGQQACNYNSITICTNTLTTNVFSSLSNNTLVCRYYNEYKQCVYGVPGCNGNTIINELTNQMRTSNVDFNARCPPATAMPPMTTTWAPPSQTTWRPIGMTPTMSMTTRPSWGCSVYSITTCLNNLQSEYGRGMGCEAAANFMKCMNKLTECIHHDDFTRARQNFKAMGLEEQCPHVMQPPQTAGASTLSAMVSLTFALVALLWI